MNSAQEIVKSASRIELAQMMSDMHQHELLRHANFNGTLSLYFHSAAYAALLAATFRKNPEFAGYVTADSEIARDSLTAHASKWAEQAEDKSILDCMLDSLHDPDQPLHLLFRAYILHPGLLEVLKPANAEEAALLLQLVIFPLRPAMNYREKNRILRMLKIVLPWIAVFADSEYIARALESLNWNAVPAEAPVAALVYSYLGYEVPSNVSRWASHMRTNEIAEMIQVYGLKFMTVPMLDLLADAAKIDETSDEWAEISKFIAPDDISEVALQGFRAVCLDTRGIPASEIAEAYR